MASLLAVNLRPPTSLTAAALSALALFVIAGCGEKSEPPTTGPVVTETTTGTTATTTGGTTTQPESDQKAIAATVTTYLTKPNDPSVCDELITPAFLKRSYGNKQGCVAARKPSALAKSVTIKPLEGGTGTMVSAKPKGGVFAGQTLKVTLINLDGQWTIDRISSNAKVGP
jgi:hypothetical protein